MGGATGRRDQMMLWGSHGTYVKSGGTGGFAVSLWRHSGGR